MTDKQIRDRIVGALSVSMMPMEMEAECVAFLDRCLKQITWHSAKELPPMHTEIYEDFDDSVDYEVSDAVLAQTDDGRIVVAKCCYDDCGKLWWFDDDGTDYKVIRWQYLPEKTEEVDG